MGEVVILTLKDEGNEVREFCSQLLTWAVSSPDLYPLA
jgi:hypothetical protein